MELAEAAGVGAAGIVGLGTEDRLEDTASSAVVVRAVQIVAVSAREVLVVDLSAGEETVEGVPSLESGMLSLGRWASLG